MVPHVIGEEVVTEKVIVTCGDDTKISNNVGPSGWPIVHDPWGDEHAVTVLPVSNAKTIAGCPPAPAWPVAVFEVPFPFDQPVSSARTTETSPEPMSAGTSNSSANPVRRRLLARLRPTSGHGVPSPDLYGG